MTESTMSRPRLALVFLFLAPFCLIGIGTAIGAFTFAARREWPVAAAMSVFALCFGGAGFGLLSAALLSRKQLELQDRMREQHPDSPWLWRRDWAERRIRDSNKGSFVAMWVFAVFWNAIACTAAVFAVRQAITTGEPKLYFVLIFPTIGLFLLTNAVLGTIRYFRYGTSILELAAVPVPIGRMIAGVVHSNADLRPETGFRVVLSSVNRRVTGSGKNRSTSENVLWQEERVIPGGTVGRTGTDIPFVIPIAADTRPTDFSNSRDQVLWKLEVSAAVPGVDFSTSFEVPVYRTAESDTPLDEAELARIDPAGSLADFQQPAGSAIKLLDEPGGFSITFPAARNPGMGFGITVFTAIWIGVVVVISVVGVPIFFPILMGLFGLIPLYMMYLVLLQWTRVRVQQHGLILTNGVLGGIQTSELVLDKSEMGGITTDIGMRSGSSAYYDIAVTTKEGKKRIAGRMIASKREAEWLAARLAGALSLPAPSPPRSE